MQKNPNKPIDEIPFNPKDILSSFDVFGMSSQEFGIYCKILFVSWIQPIQCFLPYDEHNICELCNITEIEWLQSKSRVLKKFKFKDIAGAQHIYNERLFKKFSELITDTKKTKGKQLSVQAELLNYKFDDWWNDYDKKVGDKNRILPKWLKLTDADREAIRIDTPKRRAAQHEKKFRPNPESYINGRLWENEIIVYKSTPPQRLTGNYNEQTNTPV